MRMPRLEPILTDQPSLVDIQFLEDRINDYNFSTTGYHDGRLLSIFVRDEAQNILAGLYGWTWGGCCEVRFLWVHESVRGQGYGHRLLTLAEQEAAARGCAQIVLSTHSFQAPDFYQRFGYQVVGQFSNYPKGYQQFFLCKPLKGFTTMNNEQLNALLKQVHTELEQATSLDETSRESLRALMADIQKRLDDSAGNVVPHDPNLIEQLQVEILKFELSHPVLTQAVNQVINALADAGV
jgi:GNAT superfamily N-acetyltransferase